MFLVTRIYIYRDLFLRGWNITGRIFFGAYFRLSHFTCYGYTHARPHPSPILSALARPNLAVGEDATQNAKSTKRAMGKENPQRKQKECK